MIAPKKQIKPRSRESLWKETLQGYFLALIGLGMIVYYTYHTGHGHALDKAVLWIGVGLLSFGLFSTNKKLTKEYGNEFRKFVPFLKDDNVS